MTGNDRTAGSIETDDHEKRLLAAKSLGHNVKNDKDFCALFPELVEEHEKRKAAAAAAAAAAVTGGGGAASASGLMPVDVASELEARAAADDKANPGVNILSLLAAAACIVLAIMFAVWQRQQGGGPISGLPRGR